MGCGKLSGMSDPRLPDFTSGPIHPDFVLWGVSDGTQGLKFLFFSDHAVSGEVKVDVEPAETRVLGWDPVKDEPWLTETGPSLLRGVDASFRLEAPVDGPGPTMGYVMGTDYSDALENVLKVVGSDQMKPSGLLEAVCDELATARSLIRKLHGSLSDPEWAVDCAPTGAELDLLAKCMPDEGEA